MSNGIAIELKNEFDWVEDSVMIYTTHGCTLILQGKVSDESDDFFILLEFDDVRSVRSEVVSVVWTDGRENCI